MVEPSSPCFRRGGMAGGADIVLENDVEEDGSAAVGELVRGLADVGSVVVALLAGEWVDVCTGREEDEAVDSVVVEREGFDEEGSLEEGSVGKGDVDVVR